MISTELRGQPQFRDLAKQTPTSRLVVPVPALAVGAFEMALISRPWSYFFVTEETDALGPSKNHVGERRVRSRESEVLFTRQTENKATMASTTRSQVLALYRSLRREAGRIRYDYPRYGELG